MSLKITDISLTSFRNYEHFSLSEIGLLTIFVGPNAIGKTNLIEAIQMTTFGSSFRKPTTQQLISWDENGAKVSLSIKSATRSLVIDLLLTSESRSYLLNGKKKRAKELRGILPSVIFTPDDLFLIKGSQSVKRSSLDQIGVQLTPNYSVIKRDYERILSQKNNLLKDDPPQGYLDSINETLSRIGTQYFLYRSSLLQKLIPYIEKNYRIISGGREEVTISYIPSWEESDPEKFYSKMYSKEEALHHINHSLMIKRNEEIKRKRSLIGPQADKIQFFINGKNAGLYGSQGQQRSLVLSFKIAEVEIIKEITEQTPVLLLDDVMSELDSERRHALLDFISDDIQTFITSTTLDYFPSEILSRAQIIELKDENGGS